MSAINRRVRRQFTEAAQAAAMERRREKALRPQDMTAPKLFVVRLTPASNAFTWEIRRFGGVILHRGEAGFPSMKQAYSTGALALAALACP